MELNGLVQFVYTSQSKRELISMKSLRSPLLTCAFALSAATAFANPSDGAKLPSVIGQTLSDTAFRIPADLPAAGSVVLLGFEPKHQPFIDDWTAGLGKVQPNLIVLKMPVIAPTNALWRNTIQFGMRRATPEGNPRDRTVTLFTEVAPFLAALKLPGNKTPYALAVDAAGNVLATATGPFTASEGERLVKTLASPASKP
jgi:hypothetical protein